MIENKNTIVTALAKCEFTCHQDSRLLENNIDLFPRIFQFNKWGNFLYFLCKWKMWEERSWRLVEDQQIKKTTEYIWCDSTRVSSILRYSAIVNKWRKKTMRIHSVVLIGPKWHISYAYDIDLTYGTIHIKQNFLHWLSENVLRFRP